MKLLGNKCVLVGHCDDWSRGVTLEGWNSPNLECMAKLRVDSLMSCGCGDGVSIVLVACWFWLELVVGFRLGGVVWVWDTDRVIMGLMDWLKTCVYCPTPFAIVNQRDIHYLLSTIKQKVWITWLNTEENQVQLNHNKVVIFLTWLGKKKSKVLEFVKNCLGKNKIDHIVVTRSWSSQVLEFLLVNFHNKMNERVNLIFILVIIWLIEVLVGS